MIEFKIHANYSSTFGIYLNSVSNSETITLYVDGSPAEHTTLTPTQSCIVFETGQGDHTIEIDTNSKIDFGGFDTNQYSSPSSLFYFKADNKVRRIDYLAISEWFYSDAVDLTGVEIIGSEAFHSSHFEDTLVIPNSVTTIGYQAFRNVVFGGGVTIPNSVTTIDSAAFSNCEISVFSDSITYDLSNIVTIGHHAFYNCKWCTGRSGYYEYNPWSIIFKFGSNLTSIEYNSFYNVRSSYDDTEFIFKFETNNPPTIGTDWAYMNYAMKAVVPAGSIEAYTSAFGDIEGVIVPRYNVSDINPCVLTFTTTEANEDIFISLSTDSYNSGNDNVHFADVVVSWDDGSNNTEIDLGVNCIHRLNHTFSTPGSHVVNIYVIDGFAFLSFWDEDSAVSANITSVTTAFNNNLAIGGNFLRYYDTGVDITIDGDHCVRSVYGGYTILDSTQINNLIFTSNCNAINANGYFAWACTINNLVIADGITSIGTCTAENTTFNCDIVIPDSITEISDQAFYSVIANKIAFSGIATSTPPALNENWITFDQEYISEHGPVAIEVPNESYIEAITGTIEDTNSYIINVRRDPATLIPTVLEGTFENTVTLYLASTTTVSTINIDWGDGKTDSDISLTSDVSAISHTYQYKKSQINIYPTLGDVKFYNNGQVAISGRMQYLRIGTGFSVGDYAFYKYSSPNSYPYRPNTISSISTYCDNVVIGNYAFAETPLSSGTNIRFNIHNAKTISIGNYAFYNQGDTLHFAIEQDNLTSIHIGDYAFNNNQLSTPININYPNVDVTIGEGAFYGVQGLYNISVGGNATTIPAYTFKNATALAIMLGDNINAIGEDAFSGTSARINFASTTVPFFDNNWASFNALTSIYVPEESYDSYVSAIAATNVDPSTYQIYAERKKSDIRPTVITCVGDSVSLGIYGIGYAEVDIDWGDGSDIEEYMPDDYNNALKIMHTYDESGTYEINMYTTVGDIGFAGGPDGPSSGTYTTYMSSNILSINIGDNTSRIAKYAFLNFVPDDDAFSLSFGDKPVMILGDDKYPIYGGGNVFTSAHIKNLTIPNNVTIIPQYAFSGARITNLTIDDTVTDIASNTFYYIYSDKVTIGKNVKTIESNAFNSAIIVKGAGSATTKPTNPKPGMMIFTSSEVPTFGNNWYSGQYTYPTIIFVVPYESVDAYRTAFDASLDTSAQSKSQYILAPSREMDKTIPTVFTFTTTSANEEVFVAFKTETGYSEVVVNWGDESDNTTTEVGDKITHTFATPGTYTVQVYSTIGDVSLSAYDSDQSVYVNAVSSNIAGITSGTGFVSIDENACTGTNLQSVNLDVTDIGNQAFKGCTSLETLLISGTTTIGDEAFYGCESLTSITLPSTATSIGASTFEGCTALETVHVGGNMETIGDGAFEGCTAITELELPPTLTSIGNNGFASDTITKLTVYATTPPTITATSFADSTVGVIYVPEESLEAYKATLWNDVGTLKAIKIIDPDEYDPDSIEDVPGDPAPEQNMSGAALESIIKAYGKNLKFIKTENNTIAVNQHINGMPYLSSDDLIIRHFNGYDFVECTSYDSYYRTEYISLIRVNDIRTFVITKNARQPIDGFRC